MCGRRQKGKGCVLGSKGCMCWDAKGGRTPREEERVRGVGREGMRVGVGQGMCVLGRARERRRQGMCVGVGQKDGQGSTEV